MAFEKGILLYSVGKANAGRASIVEAMGDRAKERGKLIGEELQTYEGLTIGPLQRGLCFPLVAIWAQDFLTKSSLLRATAKAPDQLILQAGHDLANNMQSEHMTRVRKRVAQNKFDLDVLGIENKVLGSYTGLVQEDIIHNLKLNDDVQAAAVLTILSMNECRPLHLGMTFSKASHAIGLVKQYGWYYVFDPNRGLLQYKEERSLQDDFEDAFRGYGKKKTVEISLSELALNGQGESELRTKYMK